MVFWHPLWPVAWYIPGRFTVMIFDDLHSRINRTEQSQLKLSSYVKWTWLIYYILVIINAFGKHMKNKK